MSDLEEISEENFEKVVKGDQTPLLVHFWASWSGPCQLMAPVISDLNIRFGDQMRFATCNIDTQPGLAARYNIASVPALIIFSNGEPVEKIMGLATLEQASERIAAIFADWDHVRITDTSG
jgi:thioredoxin 1